VNILSLLKYSYCFWFFTFYKKIVHPHGWKFFIFGIIGMIKDFSNIIAFFMPLKVIMVLSNPQILKGQLFGASGVSTDDFVYYSVFLFFLLMFLSLLCHMFLAFYVHKTSHTIWVGKKIDFPSKTKYKNLCQTMVDTVTHILIVVFGLASILFLDEYLAVPSFIILFLISIVSIWLSKNTKKELLAAPLKSPKFIFKIMSDIGFSLSFLFIFIEYYHNSNMNFLYTLLAVLITRIVLRNMQQLFVKHRQLFDDYYCTVSR